MSNDNPTRTGRTNGSAPMGSTVAIVVTAIALVVGFLILRKVNDSDSNTAKPSTSTGVTSTTTGDGASTTQASSTTTTVLVTAGTKVQVANSSNQSGVAKQMSTALAAVGFTMADATNGTANPKLTVSKVIYNASDPNAKAVADSLAGLLGGIVSEAAGLPVPVESGAWAEGSGVILLLGNDYAGKTLDQIAGAPDTGTTAPATSEPATTV